MSIRQTMTVGIIGGGNISGIYLKISKIFPCGKLSPAQTLIWEKAEARASEYGIERACAVDEMLSDKSIDIILNLTVPKAHANVARMALKAGKHIVLKSACSV